MAESSSANENTQEMQRNIEQIQEIMTGFVDSYENMDLDPFKLGTAYKEWLSAVSSDPQKLITEGLEYWKNSIELSQQALQGMLGGEVDSLIAPEKGDRRFKHDDWSEKPYFNAIQQSYLLTSQWVRNMVTDVEGLDEHTAEKVKFFTERYLDAMSPTNFAMTNPAVIEKTVATNGGNLVSGLQNMLADLEAGDGQLRISMTDTEAFELGENVGATPGKVVFQNRMFQLIQYTPSTEKVLKRPLLIVPPWINKFYILDLQPKNSFLKWATDNGHTVFVVSWVNPDETYSNTDFTAYVKEGVITAVDAVEKTTGESEINAIGYCIGGTLLSTSLAYMKAKGDKRIKSATFFTTMLDFSEPGELGVFIDEEQIGGLETKMAETGYLEGTSMAGAFNLMRANDLIWSFYVSNYLLGNSPRPFDLLYWNSDSTRMPEAMHSWYLRKLYMENKLVQPGGLSIDGIGIDLGSIDIPACFVSTADDHIAPWKSTYLGAQRLGGDVTFILGGSGHIAGIVNPPEANKYGFRISDELAETADQWLEGATEKEGSWWQTWSTWAHDLSGNKMVAARVPGKGALAVIEDAPGTYVKCKMNDPVPTLEYTDLSSVKAVTAEKAKPAAKPQLKAKPAPTPAPVKKPVAKKAVAKAKPKAKEQVAVIDDLTKVKGIGPKVAEVLNASGITSYAQLGAMKAAEISALLLEADARNKRFNPAAWPAQAKKLNK